MCCCWFCCCCGEKQEEDVSEIVQVCVANYEQLMADANSSLVTSSELEECHGKAKANILQQLPYNWKEEMKSSQMAANITHEVAEALDSAYGRLQVSMLIDVFPEPQRYEIQDTCYDNAVSISDNENQTSVDYVGETSFRGYRVETSVNPGTRHQAYELETLYHSNLSFEDNERKISFIDIKGETSKWDRQSESTFSDDEGETSFRDYDRQMSFIDIRPEARTWDHGIVSSNWDNEGDTRTKVIRCDTSATDTKSETNVGGYKRDISVWGYKSETSVNADRSEMSFRDYESDTNDDTVHSTYIAHTSMDFNDDGPAIGIDLGTTMCCVAVCIDGKVDIIPNREQASSRTTPSYVAYNEDGPSTFGSAAKDEAYRYPETTIYDAKRMIGRYWTDEALQNDRKHWPFEVVDEQGNPRIKTCNRTRFPHEVSANLLAHFRRMADDFLDLAPGTVNKAVVTVPAYFTEPQRRATSQAAECAGLEVLCILNEPTAASIECGLERGNRNVSSNVLIYDLGGGTFDVAIATLERDNVEILAVEGDTHLGGQDFDQLLMNHCIEEFMNMEGIDLLEGRDSYHKQTRDNTRRALARLKAQCEVAKERLSSAPNTRINVDHIYGDKHLVLSLTRDTFEAIIEPHVQKTLDIVDRAMKEVKSKGIFDKSDIDDIILVGGSTRIPIVQKMLYDHFGGKKPSRRMDPDEAVARGAALQAYRLNTSKSMKSAGVQDVTPLTLGMFELGDKFFRVIPRNSKIPCEYSDRCATAYDNQIAMKFTVYQGEDDTASANMKLGKFRLTGFPPKEAGKEKADLTMKIDANGLLNVSAVSITTMNSNSITISSDRLGMSDATMNMVKKEVQRSFNY